MKRTLSLSFLLFVISPVFALAQNVSRYCPDPAKDFFKGSITYGDDGKPWIEVKVDPEFEQKELREKRHITGDIPLTPVYDLVVRIKPEFNYYCIPGWTAGQEVTSDRLPSYPPIVGLIVIENNFELLKGSFSRTSEKDEMGRFVYVWKIQGWQQGIVLGDQLEVLLAAIQKGLSVQVLLKIQKPDRSSEKLLQPIVFDLCAPLEGNGRNKVTLMRGMNAVPASLLVGKMNSFVMLSQITEPFQKYRDKFSYFIDLGIHNDTAWKKITDPDGDKRFARGIANSLRSVSACGGGGTTFFLNNTSERAYAIPSVGVAFVHPVQSDETVMLHEFGHAFANLRDEYTYATSTRTPALFLKLINKVLGKNCSTNPVYDFSYAGRLYGGAQYLGCGFTKVGVTADTVSIYRPSNNSLMRHHLEDDRFNVVGCGYIIAAIKGGKGPEYFPECFGLDTIKPNQAAFYPLSIRITSIIQQLGFAQVSGTNLSSQNEDDTEVLIEESFGQSGISGNIYLIEDSSATQPTVPPAPSAIASDEFVKTENIFDTVSLDVKVNGSDGPVSIQKGGRIVVSWISEGASRCRAIWSKNDIAKSGTVAGRLSRTGSFSIRAACIDAEGNRADDSVTVNVSE